MAAAVRALGHNATNTQKLDIARKRNRLLDRISQFQDDAVDHMPEDVWEDVTNTQLHAGQEFDDDDTGTAANINTMPETIALHLPSTIKIETCLRFDLEELAGIELRMRQGQANDALGAIRIGLANISVMYLRQVRTGKTQSTKTRSYNAVAAEDRSLRHHARVYAAARHAMIALGAEKLLMDKYLELKPTDLRANTEIVDFNARGHRNDKLPWFWTINPKDSVSHSSWMKDCKVYYIIGETTRLIGFSL